MLRQALWTVVHGLAGGPVMAYDTVERIGGVGLIALGAVAVVMFSKAREAQRGLTEHLAEVRVETTQARKTLGELRRTLDEST
jgi:hypothetical protein